MSRETGTSVIAPTQPTALTAPAGSRIPTLDGLRGLAILLVMMFHETVLAPHTRIDRLVLGIGSLGWAGVDLFFVLSGFLITGILLDAKEQPHYFRNFYARRTLRIFPLYYAVVFFSLVVLTHIHHPKADHFGRIQGQEWWYWAYLSNVAIAIRAITHRPMWLHAILDVSWSLAIEEQFYLVWPAVVLLCSRHTLIRLSGILVAGALLLRVGLVVGGISASAAYVLTPCRVDSLAAGAFIAAVAREGCGVRALLPAARRMAAPAGVAAAACLLIFGGAESAITATIGFTLLASFFAAVLVLVVCAPAGSAGACLFSHPFLRTFGKYSYALYLFHVPIRAMVRDWLFNPSRVPGPMGSELFGQLMFYVLATAAAFIPAWLSWHLYEKHFLALKRFFPERHARARDVIGGEATTCPPASVPAGA